MKKVAILQSNYIPWKGYFDLIQKADVFVFYDDAQYTRRDWRNRNIIKSANGLIWLTIPVQAKGHYYHLINQIRIANPNWNSTHWKSLIRSYSKAPYFKKYSNTFGQLYSAATQSLLSEINAHFIKAICHLLNIQTEFRWSMEFTLAEDRNERLLNICKDLQATHYISGPAAKCYLDETLFVENGIAVEWMNYSDYPEYPQLHPPFTHHVSILDLIFNVGENAVQYL